LELALYALSEQRLELLIASGEFLPDEMEFEA
jgi:hypothetical protein